MKTKSLVLNDVAVRFINLNEDKDKRECLEQELRKAGFARVNRITAARHSEGARGLALSHYNALSRASEFPLLVLEDDASLCRNPSEFEYPADADVIYLGTSNWSYRPIRPNLNPRFTATALPKIYRLENMLGSHAILYLSRLSAQRFAQAAIAAFFRPNPHVDVAFVKLFRELNVYACDDPFFVQRPWSSSMSRADLWTGNSLSKYDRFHKVLWWKFPAP